jgi:hypothetical protein
MGWLAKLFGVERKEQPRIIAPIMSNFPSVPQFPQEPALNYNLEPREVKEVVFVRLDRFEHAEKDFENVKTKLETIESNIKEVDEINKKEDEELFSWGKDLEKIKMLLGKIDEKVFDQI